MRSLVRLLLLLAITVGSPRAHADARAEAQKHIDTATALFEANKPAEALVELQAAIALDPRPELLYAIGQAHASLGQCTEATKYFDRYLATRPPARAADVTKQAIAACKDAPPPDKLDQPTPQPTITPKADVTAKASVAVHSPAPWYSDKLGHVLVGGGVIATVVALVFYRDATDKIDAANEATTYPERADLAASAHQTRTFSIVFGVGGAALVSAGIVRYVLRAGSAQDGLGVAPTQGGGVVTWSGRL